MSPARVAEGEQRGYIIPVGGAEAKAEDCAILRRFVKLAGGRRGRIGIIPTASLAADTGRRYESIFRELGAHDAEAFPFEERRDCEDEDLLQRLGHCTGLFLTGGNQLRLSTILGGTPCAKQIRAMNAAGVHVAGTSAGAAFLSEHMIAFGEEGSTPKAGMVSLAPGLGLTNRIVVDQHFRQRDRLGRLLTAIAFNPFAVGIGLDEDTAAFIGPDDSLEVDGSGAVTVVDPSHLEYSSMDSVKAGEPVTMLGLRLHVLVRGGSFHLHTREASRARAAAED